MIVFPCKFGDEYQVVHRETFRGTRYTYNNAVVRGIKILPEGTEVTLLIPVGVTVKQEDAGLTKTDA